MCGYLSLKRYVFQMAIIYIMDNKLVDKGFQMFIYGVKIIMEYCQNIRNAQ